MWVGRASVGRRRRVVECGNLLPHGDVRDQRWRDREVGHRAPVRPLEPGSNGGSFVLPRVRLCNGDRRVVSGGLRIRSRRQVKA